MSATLVIPAQAGILAAPALLCRPLDSRYRGNDGSEARKLVSDTNFYLLDIAAAAARKMVSDTNFEAAA